MEIHTVDDCSEAARHVDALAADFVGVDVGCHIDVVCVVQLASARHCVLLDAIALRGKMRDLLQPLMVDRDVWKVFHGHDGVAALYQNFGVVVPPDQVWDTETMAQGLDYFCDDEAQYSLQAICKAYLHYHLDTRYKTADWDQRPLSDELLDSAAIGAQVLLPLSWEMASFWEMVVASG